MDTETKRRKLVSTHDFTTSTSTGHVGIFRLFSVNSILRAYVRNPLARATPITIHLPRVLSY